MTHKTDFFENIDDYCLDKLSDKEKLEFEAEMNRNIDLREEFELEKEIQSAIKEKDVIDLRDKLDVIFTQKRSEENPFGLTDNNADIQQVNDNLNSKDLINYYDSLPKVHVYHHELTENENTHQYYKEQNKLKVDGAQDTLNGFNFDEFEGIDDAILEYDVIDLRAKLSQVAKTVQPQFLTEDIDKYLNGEFSEDELNIFEDELQQNTDLERTVSLHTEIEDAILENDVIEFRDKLKRIMTSETSWDVSLDEIERYLDGTLEGEALEKFKLELSLNSDLKAEVDLRIGLEDAIGEIDVMELRDALASAKQDSEKHEIRAIIPDSKIRKLKFFRKSVAILAVVIGISGLISYNLNTSGNIYNSYYKTATWAPERSAITDIDLIEKGNLNFADQQYEMAIKNYEEALKLKEDFTARFYLASSWQNIDKYENAISEFNKVIAQGDNEFIEEAQWYVALCNLKLGNIKSAKVQLVAIENRNNYYKNDAKAILRRLKFLPNIKN